MHCASAMVALMLSVLAAAPVMSHHQRLELSQGAVHVLEVGAPRATVLYVHGYYTDVDDAWQQHRLADQFRQSGVQATFVVPEAPEGNEASVAFPDLDVLLTQLEAQVGALPRPIIAIGHSGACRTLSRWTASPALTAMVLLDAFYLPPTTWERWLESDQERRLVVISRLTADKAASFCSRGSSQVDCRDSELGHMELVTSGQVLPALIAELSG